MKLDPKMHKEIEKTVDGFVRKNRMAIDNAKDIDKLEKRVIKALNEDRKTQRSLFSLAHDNQMEVHRLSKRVKTLEAQVAKLVKAAKK